ncbi:hypothetical protein MCOR25_000189 [Pyricularia grisea]|nr:hypothetical protein MCOR25_000189 [Pyricularia grisea]
MRPILDQTMYIINFNLDSKMVETRSKDNDGVSTRKKISFQAPDHVTSAVLTRGGSTEPTMQPQPFSSTTDGHGFMYKKLIRPLGFTGGYSFACFVVFAGTLMGFTLARIQFINVQGVMCSPATAGGPLRHAAPGECFYFVSGATHERFGIVLHLATVLPASFLACLQLLPALRARFPALHRANGYMVLLLSLLGVVGGLMVTRNAFSGSLVTQVGFGFGAVAFLVALCMGWVSMRRMRVDQHRAWMLRAWFYVSLPRCFCSLAYPSFSSCELVLTAVMWVGWSDRDDTNPHEHRCSRRDSHWRLLHARTMRQGPEYAGTGSNIVKIPDMQAVL